MTEGLNSRPRYCAYLLRCWEVRGADGSGGSATTWRYSLEDPHNGERRGFRDLAMLVDFLRATQTAHPSELGERGTDSAIGDGTGGHGAGVAVAAAE